MIGSELNKKISGKKWYLPLSECKVFLNMFPTNYFECFSQLIGKNKQTGGLQDPEVFRTEMKNYFFPLSSYIPECF